MYYWCTYGVTHFWLIWHDYQLEFVSWTLKLRLADPIESMDPSSRTPPLKGCLPADAMWTLIHWFWCFRILCYTRRDGLCSCMNHTHHCTSLFLGGGGHIVLMLGGHGHILPMPGGRGNILVNARWAWPHPVTCIMCFDVLNWNEHPFCRRS